MNPHQRALLDKLQHMNCDRIAAADRDDAIDLCHRGLAVAWVTALDVPMWKITDAGRTVIVRHA